MYICGCKRMLMPQDWINVHTHRPGEGVNIVDPCLGNVIMPGQGAVYFSLGIHPMYIDDRVEERLQKIEPSCNFRLPFKQLQLHFHRSKRCLLYTSPSPRD